ncbi:MAG: phosphoribosylformylglycinamidine cyclo-ligase [Candidatus Auribacter fodinae]|jgi:phosphoribosylformylglycinamidine cyclo-ligase|uniref:Phosphoribosylformylglycinamidine cyclo-ligase n=1 Tax=Candidatus Auribacter fodinae TaxID=2093366 RepID=A0A3A4QV71_9BACT|nr:MAG: phosphoribosylformylglycinamidine cyclo-ligase [Candidatus Auribacter fodinae]
MDTDNKATYKAAGVDIDEGIKAVNFIKERMKRTSFQNVLSGIGGFGGIVDFTKLGLKQPALVSSIDGVGTKTKVASAYGKFEGIGRDIVSHCINDIAVQGAAPLFFMDYIGVSHLNAELVDALIAGILSICEEENCILLGGETAEMPGVYAENEFDLVGCIVGYIEKENIITGKDICPGDVIIGLPSSGLHTNGFSLARKVLLDMGKLDLHSTPAGLDRPLGDVLLEPHRCYGKIIRQASGVFNIKGIAHITGGGVIDNIPRILPDTTEAVIDTRTWTTPPIFSLIQSIGAIDEHEMHRVFNMGIGLTLIVPAEQAEDILSFLDDNQQNPVQIGEIRAGQQKVSLII